MSLSKELQIGKAGEHLVCTDLILAGYNAFLADAGLPYDVVLDASERGIFRVQVKSTVAPYERPRSGRADRDTYRFGLRKGRHYGRVEHGTIDAFAFVALDIRRVAYLHVSELVRPDGRIAGLTEFCVDDDVRRWGARTFRKCSGFPFSAPDRSRKECFRCGEVKPATPEHFLAHKRCANGLTGICLVCHRKRDAELHRARRVAA